MRLLVVLLAVFSPIGWQSASCHAQQANGEATLEGRLNSDEAQKPAASAAAAAAEPDAGPKRPFGVAARPGDGVQHPDLDKAWAYYEEAVGKVTEEVRAALAKLFDAAAAKGDLDAAEKWQKALEEFEQLGKLPTESEAKAAVSRAAADYKKASDELAKAYDVVVKALTMGKRIADAKVVRDEAIAVLASSAKLDTSSTTGSNDKAKKVKGADGWPEVGNYTYKNDSGWTAPITIEPDGVSRCEGRLGSWSRIAPNRIRINFYTGNWIEVQPGAEPGTLVTYRTQTGRTGIMRPEAMK